MNRKTKCLLAGLLLALGFSIQAKDIEFGGYTWTVRSGRGGPGPNAWDQNNAWLDTSNNLHLKISHRDGKWFCSEVTMRRRLGFGRYQFQTTGWLDHLDDNAVLGLFNYPTGDVGQDRTHEMLVGQLKALALAVRNNWTDRRVSCRMERLRQGENPV